MKRTRRLMVMLITALFIAAAVTGTALAAGKYYVPTEGVYYSDYDKEFHEEPDHKFTATYSADGKLKKCEVHQVWSDGYSHSISTYTWKGDNLSKTTYSYSSKDPENSYSSENTVKYTIKNKKPAKSESTSKGTNGSSKSTSSYKWKKNKGTVTVNFVNGTEKGSYSWKVTLKNGRISKESYNGGSTYTYSYYGNFLLKKYSSKSKTYINEKTYNKYGLPVSSKNSGTYIDNDTGKDIPYTDETKYEWKIEKGVPKEVVVTNNYTSNGEPHTYRYMWVITKTKKVSKLRNCDRYGLSAEIDF